MEHDSCKKKELDLDDSMHRFRSYSWTHTSAANVPASVDSLPADQPVICWNVSGGGNMGFGNAYAFPNLLVLPIDFCPFCGADLRKEHIANQNSQGEK